MNKIDALLRLTHPTLDFLAVLGSIAPPPTDADFCDFASNYFKSPIGLVQTKTDRLTNHL